VSFGLGLADDSALVGVYLPRGATRVLELASSATTTPASKDEAKLKLVEQVMAGVHLAAAAEAMSLGKKVGLDTKQLFEIIAGAAGNSAMFKDATPQLLSGKWKNEKTIDEVIAELVSSYRVFEVMSKLTIKRIDGIDGRSKQA
jgi:3-hydroxyisobutyrate dehydrogenase